MYGVQVEQPNEWLQELLDTMVARFERLENKGFIAPYFLDKMKRDPGEVLKFLRQNRQVVSDQLERRLDDKQRPTKQQLINRGIVAPGYFEYGHKAAMQRMNNRRSSVAADLHGAIKIRPKPEEIVKQGIISKNSLAKVYELADSDDDEYDAYDEEYDSFDINGNPLNNINNPMINASNQHIHGNYTSNTNNNNNHNNNIVHASYEPRRRPWEVSMLQSLLFATIQEAMTASVKETKTLEREKLRQMTRLNEEMKVMRHKLDIYLQQETMKDFDPEDPSRREQFVQLQNTFHLLQRQIGDMKVATVKLQEKTSALTKVENKLIDVQNVYDQKFKKLREQEEDILNELTQKRKHRDRNLRVMHAEKSHQTWAMTKLQFTIDNAKKQNNLSKLKLNVLERNSSSSNDINRVSNELESDKLFINELEQFLTSLHNISVHQNSIVASNDEDINDLQARLTRIRANMSKVRTNTFKEIHELHKDVIRADMITNGLNRKLSVATATDILTERRHNRTKIQRQLNTLDSQLSKFNVRKHFKNLNEILDVQIVMSDEKLKAFFSVFVQTFCQTLIDCELTHRQLNSNEPPDPSSNQILSNLYGISNILMRINGTKGETGGRRNYRHDNEINEDVDTSVPLNFDKKLHKIMKFIKICKRALMLQRERERREDIKFLYSKNNAIRNNNNNINNNNNNNRSLQQNPNQPPKKTHRHRISIMNSGTEAMIEIADINDNNNNNNANGNGANGRTNNIKKRKIKTYELVEIVVYIARKLCTDDNTQDEIERTPDEFIAKLAAIRSFDIFEAIVNSHKIWETQPNSCQQAAQRILQVVFAIAPEEEVAK